MSKLMASTGKVVHAGHSGTANVEPICTPYGTMGMRQKHYGRIADKHAVTCKQCLRKIAVAWDAAILENTERATAITVESGDKVARDGLKGKVLEVCTRAGVMLAAVAFGLAEFVWVRVAELVAL